MQVDKNWDTCPINPSAWKYHFNTNPFKSEDNDSRLLIFYANFDAAFKYCQMAYYQFKSSEAYAVVHYGKGTQNYKDYMKYIQANRDDTIDMGLKCFGVGLHALQDKFAHGDWLPYIIDGCLWHPPEYDDIHYDWKNDTYMYRNSFSNRLKNSGQRYFTTYILSHVALVLFLPYVKGEK